MKFLSILFITFCFSCSYIEQNHEREEKRKYLHSIYTEKYYNSLGQADAYTKAFGDNLKSHYGDSARLYMDSARYYGAALIVVDTINFPPEPIIEIVNIHKKPIINNIGTLTADSLGVISINHWVFTNVPGDSFICKSKVPYESLFGRTPGELLDIELKEKYHSLRH